MQIFAGFHRGGGVKYNKCYAYVKTLNMNFENVYIMKQLWDYICWS